MALFLQTPTQSVNSLNLQTAAKQIVPGNYLSVPLRPRLEDWTAFNPRAYLNEYYADLGEENLAILRFYVDVFRTLPQKSVMLDFGSGPTIYSLITAVTKVEEVHIVEYLEANRVELRNWFQGDNTAFNWQPFIRAS